MPHEQAHAGPGAKYVPRTGIVALSVGMTVVAVVLLYTLWSCWPTTLRSGSAPERQAITWFSWHVDADREFLFFLTAGLAGALGGLTHSLRSLAWYVGNRNLRYSWLLFHLLLPVVGALTSTVFYLVFRAGLFSTSASTAGVSPYGFAAVGVLAGLFSEQALEKLRDVAAQLFTSHPEGADHVPTKPPSPAPVDDQQVVTEGTPAISS